MLLTRITWALVVVGFGLLVGGFLVSDQNILLILAIAIELAAIILVLASWARRAKDAADAYDTDLSFAGDDTAGDDTDDDDELLETFADEEFVVGGPGSRRSSRKPATRARKPKAAARKTTGARAKTKPAAKRKPAAKSKPSAKRKPPAKAKAKPAARKPAARKPATRKPARPKPQRRRPSGG